MTKIHQLFNHYMWIIVIFALFLSGGNIYFTNKVFGLLLILTGFMLIIAIENSDMIHAVEQTELSTKRMRPFLVHFHSQTTIATFIYIYHFVVYGYLFLFGGIFVIGGSSFIQAYENIILVLLLFFFGSAMLTIFIRHIIVGGKYEHKL